MANRKRPRQHIRKMSSGKRTTVNSGVNNTNLKFFFVKAPNYNATWAGRDSQHIREMIEPGVEDIDFVKIEQIDRDTADYTGVDLEEFDKNPKAGELTATYG